MLICFYTKIVNMLFCIVPVFDMIHEHKNVMY